MRRCADVLGSSHPVDKSWPIRIRTVQSFACAAMTHANADALLQDMKDLTTFLREQKQMVSHEAWDTMAANHQSHLMARLGQLDSLNAQQATSLTAAVSALPFRDELKQQLSQAVSDTLLRPPRRNPRGTSKST